MRSSSVGIGRAVVEFGPCWPKPVQCWPTRFGRRQSLFGPDLVTTHMCGATLGQHRPKLGQHRGQSWSATVGHLFFVFPSRPLNDRERTEAPQLQPPGRAPSEFASLEAHQEPSQDTTQAKLMRSKLTKSHKDQAAATMVGQMWPKLVKTPPQLGAISSKLVRESAQGATRQQLLDNGWATFEQPRSSPRSIGFSFRGEWRATVRQLSANLITYLCHNAGVN